MKIDSRIVARFAALALILFFAASAWVALPTVATVAPATSSTTRITSRESSSSSTTSTWQP